MGGGALAPVDGRVCDQGAHEEKEGEDGLDKQEARVAAEAGGRDEELSDHVNVEDFERVQNDAVEVGQRDRVDGSDNRDNLHGGIHRNRINKALTLAHAQTKYCTSN